ncbi:TPA: hypothetical protein QCY08_003804 [Bacillus paranthracis]|nr:hypothetical protein [Bacillus paranthracis]
MAFKTVVTTLPVSEMKKGNVLVQHTNAQDVLSVLANKYFEHTGINITNDYQLHIYTIKEIKTYEEDMNRLPAFYRDTYREIHGDLYKELKRLIVTSRGYKNMVVIEVEEQKDIEMLNDSDLKNIISSHSVFID